MLTSIVSLIFTGATVIIYEHFQIKQSFVKEISALGLTFANRSAPALINRDSQVAETNLAAFRVKPAVLAACILDDKGELFVKYNSKENSKIIFPTGIKGNEYRFEDDHLLLFKTIIIDGKQIGTVFICASLNDIYSQQQYVILSVIIMILFSTTLTFFLSSWFQLFVSKPIMHLT